MQLQIWPYEQQSIYVETIESSFGGSGNFSENVLTVDLAGRLEQFKKPNDFPLLTTVSEGKNTIAACFRTDSDHRFILSNLPEAAMPLIAELYRKERPPSFFGRRVQIERLLNEHLADDLRVNMARHMTYYQLGTPNLADISRTFRAATPDDKELLVDWLEAFRLESTPEDPSCDRQAQAQQGIKNGRYFILLEGNKPLGYIGWNTNSKNPKIAPVYTDPKFRRSGVGAELTSGLIRHLQRLNPKTIGLFADIEYEPSNQLYLKLGFKALSEFSTVFVISK